jgi:hypothetical protein
VINNERPAWGRSSFLALCVRQTGRGLSRGLSLNRAEVIPQRARNVLFAICFFFFLSDLFEYKCNSGECPCQGFLTFFNDHYFNNRMLIFLRFCITLPEYFLLSGVGVIFLLFNFLFI